MPKTKFTQGNSEAPLNKNQKLNEEHIAAYQSSYLNNASVEEFEEIASGQVENFSDNSANINNNNVPEEELAFLHDENAFSSEDFCILLKEEKKPNNKPQTPTRFLLPKINSNNQMSLFYYPPFPVSPITSSVFSDNIHRDAFFQRSPVLLDNKDVINISRNLKNPDNFEKKSIENQKRKMKIKVKKSIPLFAENKNSQFASTSYNQRLTESLKKTCNVSPKQDKKTLAFHLTK